MQKEIKKLRKSNQSKSASDFCPTVIETPKGKFLVGQVDLPDPAAMRTICDVQRQQGAAGILVGGAGEGKVTLVAMVADEIAKSGMLKAGDWVQAAAEVVGGRGGGKPTLAQAGGKDPEKLPEAIKTAAKYIQDLLT